MLLIADSGSTNTDWLLMQADGTYVSLKSQGLNPYMVLPEDFSYTVRNTLSEYLYDVSAVKFYGSGCTEEMIPSVKQNLQDIFVAAEVDVYSDLVASAHATLGYQKGITAILGTGSNSGYFDGNKITSNVPSLGYVLGDEGSGNWMGKRLLRDFLRNTMPEDLRKKLEKDENVNLPLVLHKVYKESTPNAFLGSFTYFIQQNIEHPYCIKLVRTGFQKFIDHCLLNYPNVENEKIGFIGSVASVFHNILSDLLKEYGMEDFVIVRSPLDGLKVFYESFEG